MPCLFPLPWRIFRQQRKWIKHEDFFSWKCLDSFIWFSTPFFFNLIIASYKSLPSHNGILVWGGWWMPTHTFFDAQEAGLHISLSCSCNDEHKKKMLSGWHYIATMQKPKPEKAPTSKPAVGHRCHIEQVFYWVHLNDETTSLWFKPKYNQKSLKTKMFLYFTQST